MKPYRILEALRQSIAHDTVLHSAFVQQFSPFINRPDKIEAVRVECLKEPVKPFGKESYRRTKVSVDFYEDVADAHATRIEMVIDEPIGSPFIVKVHNVPLAS